MQIDKLAIDMHPRSSWKAFDLGCKMALRWYPSLFGFWLLATAPLFVILCLLNLNYGPILIWLLKPLFERGLLYIFSREVFGQSVSAREALKAWPAQLKNLWFSSITWRRLSPTRGFDLAVIQLEGLTGQARANRLRVLHHSKDDNSAWWLIICVHWEMFLVIAGVAIVTALLPEGIDFSLFASFESEVWTVVLGYNLMAYSAMALVAPFFIAGSFSAYLNRRTQLEGWDIELQFKKILASQTTSVNKVLPMVAVFCLSLLLAPVQQAEAQDSVQDPGQHTAQELLQDIAQDQSSEGTQPNQQIPVEASAPDATPVEFESQQRLEAILEKPPFYQSQTEKDWRWIGFTLPESDTEQEPSSWPKWILAIFKFIASVSEVLLWVVFAVIIGVLAYLSRHLIAPLLKLTQSSQQPNSDFVASFSQTYQADSLPDDIEAEIDTLLSAGHYRQLLSLLLISSLTDISRYQSLPLTKAMTEKECLRVIKQSVSGERSEFMSKLVNTWTSLAWAHQFPSDQHMQEVCNQYRSLFLAPEAPI